MTQPTIVFSPLQAGVPAEGGALEVLVRVQAPDRPADLAVTHLPKRLALVVDRSGSMGGGTVAGFLERGLNGQRTVGLEFDGTPAEGFNPLHNAQCFWAEIFLGVIID